VAVAEELAQWMIEVEQGTLTDFDGFILDASSNEGALKSLEGRLSSDAIVLIPGAEGEAISYLQISIDSYPSHRANNTRYLVSFINFLVIMRELRFIVIVERNDMLLT